LGRNGSAQHVSGGGRDAHHHAQFVAREQLRVIFAVTGDIGDSPIPKIIERSSAA